MLQAVARARRSARRSRLTLFLGATMLAWPLGYALAMLVGLAGRQRIVVSVVASAALVAAASAVRTFVPWFTGRAVGSIVNPGGRARPEQTHSHALALAAAGRLTEANDAFDALRRTGGDDVPTLRAEAELHARPGGDPARAAELLQRLRKVPTCTLNDELYATHRLIDLYLGPLNDAGKVMVELRRMADRFPQTIDGQSALAELRRRREELPATIGEVT